MKLTATVRASTKKSDMKQARREGKIPAIFYSTGEHNQQLIVDAAEFNAILRQIKPGRLSTTVFSIVINGTTKKAIIKDIQYQLTTYRVSHIDFKELVDNVSVSLKVPIECVGVAECIGVKLRGFLHQPMRHVNVECLPEHIPSQFEINVENLEISQSKRLSDIVLPKGVKLLARMDEVVVAVSKRAT